MPGATTDVFSRRVPGDLGPNALARLRAARGRVQYDLTVSNPTVCGIGYPETLLAALSDPAGLVYRPDPRGIESARRAVAEEYRRHGVALDPERIVLTASSSEAYGFLFKLLCDPGDAVRIPLPSYPLFDHLASLDGVRAVPYRLDPLADWQPELDGERRARAVLVVHPNNPTGSFVHGDAAERLRAACRERGAALVSDEVFLDYPLGPGPAPPSLLAGADTLTFALGGLSKSLGLPQLKLSWIALGGPDGDVTAARDRLEFIADNYLSVSTPVQLALPRLLAEGAAVRAAILDRCLRNLALLEDRLRGGGPVSLLRPEGGWTAVLRFPAVASEESLAIALLEHDGVAVQPGYFFDFPGEGYLVVSLLPEPAVFAAGIDRLLARLGVKS